MVKFEKLTRSKFARAMKLGQGRALLHVKEYGDEGIEEDIKHSLLVSHSYDVSVEGLRSWWLWQIVTLTGRPHVYGNYLLNNFNQPTRDNYDIAQQFQLAVFFFELGMNDFRAAMCASFGRMAHETHMSYCGQALVAVSRLAGLEFVAKTCGAIPNSMDDYECAKVLECAIEACDESTVMEHMTSLGNKEPSVQAFMDICKEFKAASKNWTESSTAVQPTLEDLLALIQKNEQDKFPGKFRMFGKRATEDELAKVLDLLKHANDEKHQLAFLRVFQLRAMPEISPEVINLIQAKNPEVRRTAAMALSHVKSVLVRDAALFLLQSDKSSLIPLGVELLKHNYVPQDADVITKSLQHLRAATDVHSTGMAIRNMCDTTGGTELEIALLWLYENGPDSFCRSTFLEQLVDWQKCPMDILYEAQWDAGDETREFARRKMSQYEANPHL